MFELKARKNDTRKNNKKRRDIDPTYYSAKTNLGSSGLLTIVTASENYTKGKLHAVGETLKSAG